LEMLLVLLRAVVAAGEGQDQGVVALDLAEPPVGVGVVGELVVGEGSPGDDVGAHGVALSVGAAGWVVVSRGRAAGPRRCRTSRRSGRCWSSGARPARRRRPGRPRARSGASYAAGRDALPARRRA